MLILCIGGTVRQYCVSEGSSLFAKRCVQVLGCVLKY